MKQRVLVIAALTLLVACGKSDDSEPATPQRQGDTSTVNVEMVDIDFKPETLRVQRGEKVRFVFTNSGRVRHEAFIGDAEAQKEHEREMREGGHGHGSSDAVVVEPGGTGELTYTFDEAGTLEIGCHEPGHYPVGMKINVEVT
ncbi:MAG: cupredoxin domain-containing protein [Actinomycetota bacterium]|nr:cupredoxin domain-containing protein [Actinomycetota bacterium]